jgi:hypothetical protein
LVRKFFKLDKNYLLEASQLRCREDLLSELLDRARLAYEERNNPLGLQDLFSEKILQFKPNSLEPLFGFYENLAGIYRYKYGETQLGFLWDGKDHADQYKEDWTEAFRAWTIQLCYQPQFVQAVLDLTVFLAENPAAQLTESRMNAVMLNLFELRIHKSRGIVEQRAQA